ncbi:DUF4026 domain-containing protein [Carnobacterium gallinarum]|uniref:DUF4026 domain-containing protein n=1 Tax=Carnobacterium gallinarum TaxID=2749 RepID=UPI00068D4897|nr:DUF4026 domain-containing protein [Carnobacterium gallinarum]
MSNQEFYQQVSQGTIVGDQSTLAAFLPNEQTMEQLEKRFTKNSEFSLIEWLSEEDECAEVKFMYQEEVYSFLVKLNSEVEQFEFEYMQKTEPFSEAIYQAANQAPMELYVGTIFGRNILTDYLLQLKLLYTLAPDLIIGRDVSAANKLFSNDWLAFQTESDLLPEIGSLYTIHAVYDSKNSANQEPDHYWFHTHGLTRCRLTELELIIPNKLDSTYGIEDLFGAFVNRCINQEEMNFQTPLSCIQTSNYLISCIPVPWEEGLSYVGKKIPLQQLWNVETADFSTPIEPNGRFLGDLADRDEYHSGPSSLIFGIFGGEEVDHFETIFNGFLDQQSIMTLKSDKETAQLILKAKKRWVYFENLFNQYHEEPVKSGLFSGLFKKKTEPEWQFIIKCGIRFGKGENECEHMWFEPISLNGDTIEAKLIVTPFYVETMKENGIYQISMEDLTDWIVSKLHGASYKPDTIYQAFLK